jgi:hypothetical protein
MSLDPQRTGLARGKGRTQNPRIYAGCLPCKQGRWVADLEHANIWIVAHWRRCKHPLPARGSQPVREPQDAARAPRDTSVAA